MLKALKSMEEVAHFSMSSVKFQGHTGQKTKILTPFRRFQIVTPVWIHWWLWNDAQSLKQHRLGAILFFKVIRQISRSHGTKKSPNLTRIKHFRTITPVLIHPWLWNDADSYMQFIRPDFEGTPSNFTITHNKNNCWFWPELRVSGL